MTTPKRFSKDKLREHLERRLAQVEIEYGFDMHAGDGQCLKRGVNFAVAYGKALAFQEIWEEMGL